MKLRFEDATTQAIAYELGHLVTVGKLYLYRHLLGPKGNSTHYTAKIDAGGHLALAALECKPSVWSLSKMMHMWFIWSFHVELQINQDI